MVPGALCPVPDARDLTHCHSIHCTISVSMRWEYMALICPQIKEEGFHKLTQTLTRHTLYKCPNNMVEIFLENLYV